MTYTIDRIRKEDNDAICHIIQTVGAEHGAIGDGFGPSDPEVTCMSEHYLDTQNSLYLVARLDDKIVGGSGIAPFNKSVETCELKKLYLLPETRGLGMGLELTLQCLQYARSQGFAHCYLDTLSTMKPAIALYERLGFKHLSKPPEGTEHNGCDVWMLKDL